ncbi:hypothetical protein CRN74_02675 [Yersinia frederiksenii]|nr:hypothetical protein [Yersinia frederiksenii]ATM85072.1 hypothetical protein CRN74_02675 [Yersinia frederiksenii]
MEVSPLSNNSSNEAGWLTPISDGPAYDETLERLLSQWVRGVSGLPDGHVRPRWTAVQPPIMEADINWCGFGIIDIPDDASPAFENQTENSTELWRHEEIECMASFYGPSGQRYATQFRDGLTITQNNDELVKMGLSLARYSRINPFPELINNKWVRRFDITVKLRRKVIREYGIKSLTSAPVKFFGE